jgi:C-terminal peptidase prc
VASWQLEVFEELWSAVKEEYLYSDFNGVDWDAIHEEYLARIQDGMEPQEFYFAMDEMLFRLGDDHSFFLDPTQVVEEERELAGELEYVGIGILITTEPERGRAIVLLTFPDSPAEEAGLRSRDLILEVDGLPVTGQELNLGQLIRGPAGTEVTLTVQSPGGEPRTVRIVREQIFGPIRVPFQALETQGGERIGYLMIPTFADSSISDQVEQAIDAMGGEEPLDGLIVDNRWNNGGVDTMLRGTLSLFVQGLVGYFVNNDGDRALTVEPNDISGSQDLDLVVLIGPDTISFGEIFAGILSDLGRAYLIGELTSGNVETLWGYDFSDGSRAWIAHDSFRPLNDPNADWESNGVIPDETVEASWEEFALEDDPVIRAALDYFDIE